MAGRLSCVINAFAYATIRYPIIFIQPASAYDNYVFPGFIPFKPAVHLVKPVAQQCQRRVCIKQTGPDVDESHHQKKEPKDDQKTFIFKIKADQRNYIGCQEYQM